MVPNELLITKFWLFRAYFFTRNRSKQVEIPSGRQWVEQASDLSRRASRPALLRACNSAIRRRQAFADREAE